MTEQQPVEPGYVIPAIAKQMLAEDVPWMGVFRTNESAEKLTRNALRKGDKIGAYNLSGALVWIARNVKVIQLKDTQ